LVAAVRGRLSANKRLRRTLPGGGRLHIDRQLPFLCVYRQPAHGADPGTPDLVKSEASYLIAPGERSQRHGIATLVDAVVETLSQEFGAFAIVEVWSAADGGSANDPRSPEVCPRFRVVAPKGSALSSTVFTLASGLKKIRILKQFVEVDVDHQAKVAPPGLLPLMSRHRAAHLGCTFLGIEVPPVYRDAATGQQFPLVLRSLRSRFGTALRRGIFEFTNSQTTHSPPHYHSLGRRAVVKAVWEVDARLAEVGEAFDFLLQVTPINSDVAWTRFRAARFERAPEFHYLPSPMDPSLLKRRLYKVPVERVEDPALHRLFEQKREELDRQVTMLGDRNTSRFLYGSLQLFGKVGAELLEVANQILDQKVSRRRDDAKGGSVWAEEFAERAREELAYYHDQHPDFVAQARITSEVAGLMVTRSTLLISRSLSVPRSRLEALLHHEVGTHLLTYFNGKAQPFRQLYSGLAGYDELQEGLAVMAEYVAGGLSQARLRQLAARVVAVKHLTDGASFVETFRALVRECGFSQRVAFTITMRVYRGGGLTKDVVYLRGLQTMLQYMNQGGDLEPLLIGKIAAEHVPIIRELQFRQVLRPPPLRPRYLDLPASSQRIDRLRTAATVLALLKGSNA
jgi:uncharacterized protein (TIGR02421 family)